MILNLSLLRKPEHLFVLIALLFGIPLTFILPTGAGFDELAHLARAVEISYGELIPNRLLNQETRVPLSVNEINYRARNFYEPLERDWFARFKARPVAWEITFPKDTYSVYFPSLYLPQAGLTALARTFNFSLLTWYYSLRLAELAGYILLSWLAIRWVPLGKWLFFLLALAPTPLLQAVSISTDPYSSGAALLFIAWMLRLAMADEPITWRDVLLTLLTTALLFSAKVNTAGLAVLFLLLPVRRFASRRQFWLFLGGVLLLFAVQVILWNGFVSLTFRTDRADRGIWMMASTIFADPLGFIRLLFSDILSNGLAYLREWIAVTPNYIGKAPALLYPLFLITLVATLLSEPAGARLTRRMRTLLIAGFLLSYFFSALFLYLGGRGPGDGIDLNGRYLSGFMPALLLACIPPSIPRPFRRLPPALPAVSGALAAGFIFLSTIYLIFHVHCGQSRYLPGPCILPEYRNLDPYSLSTAPLTDGVVIAQEFRPQCATLTSLMIWPVQIPSRGEAQTIVRLESVETGALLAETSFSNLAPSGEDWYTLALPPTSVKTDSLLRMTFSSPTTRVQEAIALAVSPTGEYEAGRYLVNGAETSGDLYFHYGCPSH